MKKGIYLNGLSDLRGSVGALVIFHFKCYKHVASSEQLKTSAFTYFFFAAFVKLYASVTR